MKNFSGSSSSSSSNAVNKSVRVEMRCVCMVLIAGQRICEDLVEIANRDQWVCSSSIIAGQREGRTFFEGYYLTFWTVLYDHHLKGPQSY